MTVTNKDKIVVKKIGSSVLAGIGSFKAVAKALEVEAKESKIVIVASAFLNETNKLIKLGTEVIESDHLEDSPHFHGIVATGEQISSCMLALAFEGIGYKASSWNCWQLGITYNSHQSTIDKITEADKIIQFFANGGNVAIVTGFQALDANNQVVTLGRGGSDLTAIAMAEALGLSVCEVYKDTEGVYTANPDLCSNAVLIKQINYHDMIEMSFSGAEVMQKKALHYARKSKVDIVVKKFYFDDQQNNNGTLITGNKLPSAAISVSCMRNISLLSISGIPFGKWPAIINAYRHFIGVMDSFLDVIAVSKNNDDIGVKIAFRANAMFIARPMSYITNTLMQISPDIKINHIESDLQVSAISLTGKGCNVVDQKILSLYGDSCIDCYSNGINRCTYIVNGNYLEAKQVAHNYILKAN